MELTLLNPHDADALWQFESQHRAYFEHWVNARAPDFYTPQGFAHALQQALLLQASHQAYHYLIWDQQKLVGRVNLTQVKHQNYHSALLGYRIAPSHGGQGLTSEAVALVVQKAFQEHQLKRLEATARPENPASIRILLKNGFRQFGHSQCAIELRRQWFDLLYFEAHAQPCTPQA